MASRTQNKGRHPQARKRPAPGDSSLPVGTNAQGGDFYAFGVTKRNPQLTENTGLGPLWSASPSLGGDIIAVLHAVETLGTRRSYHPLVNMGLTLPQGRLFGAVVEAILYGVNVILILAALCLLGQHNEPSYTQRARVSLIFVIFVLCTMHLTAVLEGVRQAFFEWPSPDEYYRDISQPPNVIANAAYGVAVMVADGIMIHRVYIIFGNRWKVILVPCFSTVVTAAVWFVLVHVCRMAPRNPDTYLSIVGRLAPAAYILSFATNIIITMQIIIRIVISMRLVRDLRPESGCFHRRCLAYTIESGVLYPLSLLATGILWFLKNDSLDILAGSNLQLLCMVPILLSLQMRLRLSIYDAAKGFQITPFPTRVSGMSQTSQHPQTVHRSRLPSLTLPVGFRDGRRGLPANGLIHISDEMLQSQSLPSPASTDDSTMSSQLVK